jgi:hypothetical protein
MQALRQGQAIVASLNCYQCRYVTVDIADCYDCKMMLLKELCSHVYRQNIGSMHCVQCCMGTGVVAHLAAAATAPLAVQCQYIILPIYYYESSHTVQGLYSYVYM